jgi:hypothetical protein
MKVWTLGFLALASVLLLTSTPIRAHHGAASYDMDKLTTLKGTITDFQFMNPHTEVFFDVNDAAGNAQKWTAEALSATSMSRQGWTKNILKAGDQVSVIGNISKNGSHTMRLNKIVLATGKELTIEF